MSTARVCEDIVILYIRTLNRVTKLCYWQFSKKQSYDIGL